MTDGNVSAGNPTNSAATQQQPQQRATGGNFFKPKKTFSDVSKPVPPEPKTPPAEAQKAMAHDGGNVGNGDKQAQAIIDKWGMDDEIELQFGDKTEKKTLKQLKAEAQKFYAAEKRLQELSEERKNFESERKKYQEIVQRLKTDPKAKRQALSEIFGSDDAVREIAMELVWEQMQEEQKSPQQKEYERIQRENQELKRKYEMREMEERRQAEEYERSQRVEHWRQTFDNMFSNVLQKTSLPKNQHTMERIVDIANQMLEAGIDISEDMLLNELDSTYQNVGKFISSLPPEQIVKYIGEDGLNKVREYSLEKVKNPFHSPQKAEYFNPQEAEQRPNQKKTIQEWKKDIYKRAGLS